MKGLLVIIRQNLILVLFREVFQPFRYAILIVLIENFLHFRLHSISPLFIFIRSYRFLDSRCGFTDIEKICDADCKKILFLLLFRIVDIHIIVRIYSNIFDDSAIPICNLIYRILFISLIRRHRNTLSSIFQR